MSVLDFDRSLAVVIGINQYSSGITPLRTAVADAEAIAQSLQDNHNYEVITLLDETAQLANLRTLVEKQLPAEDLANSRLLFYFAGHGIAQDGDDGPAGYLIPQDAVPGKVESYLPMVELHDALTVLPCRHFLAIFDCCFAGAFRWSSTRDIEFVPDVIHQERYDRFRQDPAWQVITSAAYDQKAMDVLSLQDDRGELTDQHSPFAAALLSAFEGAADAFPPAKEGQPAGDGVITATELYLYLRDSVEGLTKGQRKRQTPELCPLRKHDKGEYIFLTPGHALNLPPAPELNKENNPYRGLESFDQSHRNLFFGRDQEIEQLLQKLVDPHPLTVVLGASGTGKSSLVKAGLLPRLENRPEFCVLPVMRPGNDPLAALARVCESLMANELVADDTMSTLTRQFAEDEYSLSHLIERWHRGQATEHPETKVLLVIDQAEELITQAGDASTPFQKLLKHALAKQWQHLHVVATLRLDFEAQFQDDDLLGKDWMDSRFVVPPMGQQQLRQAIELPAASRVLCFEPSSLVDKLVEDVSQTPGALPLLSFTLSELYLRYLENRSNNRALTETDYRALGGVSGALTKRATQEYTALVAEDSAYAQTVKHVMLRMVATEGGELARRRVPLAELVYERKAENERVQRLLERMIAARLVVQGQSEAPDSRVQDNTVQDADGHGTYVEPAHDALVRGWDLLLRWKTEEQVNLSLQRQLTPPASNWLAEHGPGKGKHAKGFLWDANPRLPLLKEVLEGDNNWLNRAEEGFVRRSLARKRNRRTRLVSSAIGVMVGLSGLSAIALIQRGVAKREATRANEQTALAVEQNIRSEANATDAFILASQPLKGAIAAVTAWQQTQVSDITPNAIRPARAALIQAAYYSKPANLESHLAAQGTIAHGGFKEKNVLTGHNTLVGDAIFSPDGNTIASAGGNNTIHLWDAHTGKLQQTLTGYPVLSIAFSPDGKNLVAGNNNGSINNWDISSGEVLNTLNGEQGWVTSVAFSPDGTKIVSGGIDQTIQLWDANTGQLLTTIAAHDAAIKSVVFSADSTQVASASEDTTIKLWDANTGQLLNTFAGHNETVTSVVFNVDGTQVASASEDTTIKLWDANTGQRLNTLEGHSGSVRSVAFSPDGTLLTSASDDNTIKVWTVERWDAEAGQLLNTLKGHSNRVNSAAFSPAGNRLVSASVDQTVRLWDRRWDANPTPLLQTLAGNSDGVDSIAFSPDGDTLAAASSDATLQLWDMTTDQLRHTLEGHRDRINNLAYSPEGNLLASASSDATIKLWNAHTGQLSLTLESHTLEVKSVAFSPDGNTLASSSDDRTLKLWDTRTGELQKTIESDRTAVGNVIFSPDGSILAGSSEDQTIHFWDASTGQLIQTLGDRIIARMPKAPTVAFSPDGNTLAAINLSKNIQLWDANTGQLRNTLEGHTAWVETVTFSPDSTLLASASGDHTIKLWDTHTGQLLNTLEGHIGVVSDLAFGPDGNTIASASDDPTIKLWTLNPAQLAQWHCGWLSGYLAHHPEGQRAAMAGVCQDN